MLENKKKSQVFLLSALEEFRDRCKDAHTDALSGPALLIGCKEVLIFIDYDSSHCDTEKSN